VTTDNVPLRSRVAAGVRHKPPRHIEVTSHTRPQKGCVAILSMTHRAEASPLASQRNGIITSTETALTDNVSLRSRIAGGVGHEPSRDIKVTTGMLTCQQKGCATILITAPHTHQAASPLASPRNGTITSTETATADLAPLRSRIAAGVGHEPSRDIKVTVRTCQQKGCVTVLITKTTRDSRKHLTITTKPSSHTE
jgi:riboflavin biosynthesis pyrimidine reductase